MTPPTFLCPLFYLEQILLHSLVVVASTQGIASMVGQPSQLSHTRKVTSAEDFRYV
jgi:hypothetical protein